MKKFGIMGVIFLILATVPFFYSGAFTEKALDHIISEALKNSNIQIEKINYDRQLYSSTARYQLSIANPDMPIYTTLDLLIDHGFLSSTAKIKLADEVINDRIQQAAVNPEQVAYEFKIHANAIPLIGNAFQLEWHNQAINYADENISLDISAAAGSYILTNDALVLQGLLPGFSLTVDNEDVKISMGEMRVASNISLPSGGIRELLNGIGTGNGELSIDDIKVSSSEIEFAIKQIKFAMKLKSGNDRMVYTQDFTIRELNSNIEQMINVNAAAFKMNIRFDKEGMRQLNKAMQKYSQMSAQEKMIASIDFNEINRLTEKGVDLTIDDFSVKTDKGEAVIKGDVKLPPFQASEIQIPLQVLGLLKINMFAAINKNLLKIMPDKVQKLAQQYTQMGMIEFHGDKLQTQLLYDGVQLTMNNQRLM